MEPERWSHCDCVAPGVASLLLTMPRIRRLLLVERVLTTAGLVTAGCGLMCLLIAGLGWLSGYDFICLWLILVISVSPFGVWIDRWVKLLLWS